MLARALLATLSTADADQRRACSLGDQVRGRPVPRLQGALAADPEAPEAVPAAAADPKMAAAEAAAEAAPKSNPEAPEAG